MAEVDEALQKAYEQAEKLRVAGKYDEYERVMNLAINLEKIQNDIVRLNDDHDNKEKQREAEKERLEMDLRIAMEGEKTKRMSKWIDLGGMIGSGLVCGLLLEFAGDVERKGAFISPIAQRIALLPEKFMKK